MPGQKAEGAQSKERKGSNFAAQHSAAIVPQAQRAKRIQSKSLSIAIWQPCLGELAVCDDKVVGGDDPEGARPSKVAVDGTVARRVAEGPFRYDVQCTEGSVRL